jgi:hypothetical protein
MHLGKNKGIFEKLVQAYLFIFVNFYFYWTQCCGFAYYVLFEGTFTLFFKDKKSKGSQAKQ